MQRHGIARLPDVEGDKPVRRKFKDYPIGFFHLGIAELRTEQGKSHMCVAIDRTSKFAFVELHETATTATSRDFLLCLIAAVPYKIRTVLTDNGIRFTTPDGGGSAVPSIKEASKPAPDPWAVSARTGQTVGNQQRTDFIDRKGQGQSARLFPEKILGSFQIGPADFLAMPSCAFAEPGPAGRMDEGAST